MPKKQTKKKVVKVKSIAKRKSGAQKKFAGPITADPTVGALVKIIESLKVLLKIQKAGFMDSWRSYCQKLADADLKAEPTVYLDIFRNVAPLIGVTAEELEEANDYKEQSSDVGEPLVPATDEEDKELEEAGAGAVAAVDGLNILG